MNLPIMLAFASVDTVAFLLFWFSIFNRRFGKLKSAIIALIFVFLSLLKHALLLDHMLFRAPIQWVLSFVTAVILFTDSPLKILCIHILNLVWSIVAETLTQFFGLLLGYDFTNPTLSADTLVVMLAMITMSIIFYVCAGGFIKRKSSTFEDKSSRLLLIYGAVQTLYFFILYAFMWDYGMKMLPILICVIISMVLSSLLGVLLYRNLRQAANEKARAEQTEAQIRLTNEHFGRLQRQYEQYRKLRHDYYNHINVIKNMSDSDTRKAYIDDLSNQIEELNGIAFCSNPAIDSVLFAAKSDADGKGVRIEFQICDMNGVKLPDTDICSVLFNLIDNALRAASEYESSERFVNVIAAQKAGQLIVTVRNSCNKPSDDLATTKKNKDEHGIGISIVREIAKKHRGAFVYSYADNVFSSTCSMQLD